MVLVIDIGNTNVVLGGYGPAGPEFTARLATDRTAGAAEYEKAIGEALRQNGARDIRGAALSSVVPAVTGAVAAAVQSCTGAKPLVLHWQGNTGVPVCIDDPAELGADILATAIAVKETMPLPAVVIDMGTATTITAMDAAGAVQGVAIVPGVVISLEALTGRTSQLHDILLEAPAHAIGKNTTDSMKSGMIFGAAAMLDGMIDRFEAELGGPAYCVATGGLAGCITPHCRHEIRCCDTLLLDGLYRLYLRGERAE